MSGRARWRDAWRVAKLARMDTTLRLTDVLGRPVVDRSGTRLGRVSDLLVDHAERYPRVTAIAIGRRRAVTLEPWSSVVRLEREVVLQPSGDAAAGDLHLARDLLDAQVVDIAGQRLARVGEIELVQRGSRAASPSPSTSVSRRSSVGSGCDGCPAACTNDTIGWEGPALRDRTRPPGPTREPRPQPFTTSTHTN